MLIALNLINLSVLFLLQPYIWKVYNILKIISESLFIVILVLCVVSNELYNQIISKSVYDA
jgi:hypothetical protein